MEIQKKLIPLPPVEVTTVINPLKLLQLCENLLFLLKTNTLVVMLFRLLLSILSMILEIMLNELLHTVVLSLLTRLRRKMISVSCHANLNYLLPADDYESRMKHE